MRLMQQKSLSALFVSIGLLCLIGCGPAIWNGRNEFHNHVGTKEQNKRLYFKANSSRLTATSKNRLHYLLAKSNQPYQVYLSHCAAPRASQHLERKRMKRVKRKIQRAGLSPIVLVNVAHGGNKAPCMNITIRRLYVVTPKCPDLTDIGSSYYDIDSNFGCSTTRNLGVMIADANDLKPRQIIDNFDGRKMAHGYEKYTNPEIKAKAKDNTLGNLFSDLLKVDLED